MARETSRQRAGFTAPSVTELHRVWLELVDSEGPFLAIPPLKRVWPQGMPSLSDDRKAALVDARKHFEAAWEKLDRAPDNEAVLDAYRIARDKWVETVLRDVAGWADSLAWGEVPGVQAQSPNRAVTVTAQAALHGADGIGALVHIVDPTDSVRQTPNDLWAATPIDRTEALLRENKVQLGIVTDGRWWGLACVRDGAMAASGVVDALTWIEEPRTRDAFLALIGRQHIIGGDPAERLPVLFEQSVAAAEEITEALGSQVRSAVELLIQSFSESAADANRRGLPDPLPARTHETYEAAVTVMMRAVFLLFAEERGLLPSGELFDQGYGIARSLDRLMARETEESEEALDATSLVWHRMLATSQALFSGASFESLRMPAYGGSLFDPLRFPFLTATNEQGTLAVTVSDRVMLHVLRSVQIAEIKGEARRISFRDIDVEQIGYIYEGLLGYTAAKVDQTYVGMKGGNGVEPEIPLAKLEELAAAKPDPKKLAAAMRSWVDEDQPSAKALSAAAIAKAITADVDASVVSALTQAVGDDAELKDRVRPWLGMMRLDLRKRPFVVLTGGLMVKETPSRKNAGAHYTPKSLAEEVVVHTLQGLCYAPGPHQTADETSWRLKTSDELLDLKVADIACGSGAFLVAAARYLADRVVEAWIAEDSANAARKDLHTRAVRQVVASCLYGADINDMAVEMCKLSLWLVSLDRDLPFSFVDDKVFTGNSLLGLTDLDQLRKLHIAPSRISVQRVFDIFDVDVDSIIRKAVELRQRLATEIDEGDPARNSGAKRRQLAQFYAVTSTLRRIGDGVVAAGLPLGGRPGKALDEAYTNLREAVKASHPVNGGPEAAFLDALVEVGLTPTVETDYERWRPLHWVLEAPDVMLDHGGFDAVVGNPPFLAGKKIAIATGSDFESWTKVDLAGQRGSADICAHFIRRAWSILNGKGSIGLIANDRIGQGDTAAMSSKILAEQGQIYRAISEFRWPGKASTGAAIIWASKGRVSGLSAILDGNEVASISASLTNGAEANLSQVMKLEMPFLAGNGVALYGEGLVLDLEDALVTSLSTSEMDFLRPFVNGQSLMSGELSGRVAIDVDQFLDEGSLFVNAPTLAEHLQRTVKPARDAITSQIHEHRYWAHWDKRENLFAAAGELDRFIVLAKDTRVPVFLFSDDHESLYSDKVIVMATDSPAVVGVLSSTVHFAWFEQTRTGRGTTSSYIVSRCLRTFPFPADMDEALSAAGSDFVAVRDRALAKIVSATKLYNQIDDPDVSDPTIVEVRSAIARLDDAVVRSYGWTDLSFDLDHFEFVGSQRFTASPRVRSELRRRLVDVNLRQFDAATPLAKARVSRTIGQNQDAHFGDM